MKKQKRFKIHIECMFVVPIVFIKNKKRTCK
jgi:hypothetical protein